MKVDESYDDLWRSIGHSVAICAILDAFVDFYYIAAILLLTMVGLKVYESKYKTRQLQRDSTKLHKLSC